MWVTCGAWWRVLVVVGNRDGTLEVYDGGGVHFVVVYQHHTTPVSRDVTHTHTRKDE